MTSMHDVSIRELCVLASTGAAAEALHRRGIDVDVLSSLLSDPPSSPSLSGTLDVELRSQDEQTSMVVHVPHGSPRTAPGAIVLLHGAGSSGHLIGDLASDLCCHTGMYVLCPTATAGAPDNRNFELGGLFGKRVQHPRWDYGAHGLPIAALQWALRHLPLDPDRCVLMGHSMGAIATWNVAARCWHSWAGAAPINGTLSMWERFGPDDRAQALLPNLAQLSVCALHGNADQRVPAELEAATIEALRALGNSRVQQILIDGAEHPLSTLGLVPGAPAFDALCHWVDACRRASYPRLVSHCVFDVAHGRAHWIEVVELAEQGGPARVQGCVVTDSEIVVRASGARRLALHMHRRLVKPGDVRIVVNGRAEHHYFEPRLECLIDTYRTTFDTGLLSEDIKYVNIDESSTGAEEGEKKWTVNTTC